MKEGQGWSGRSLCRLLGIPTPTLSYWISSGLVTPDRRGRGRVGDTIGLTGLMEVLTIQELRGLGFSLQKVRDAVEKLRQLTGAERPLARQTIVVRGKDIVWRDEAELTPPEISALRAPGQRLLLLPVGEQHDALRRKLASSPETWGSDRHGEHAALSPEAGLGVRDTEACLPIRDRSAAGRR